MTPKDRINGLFKVYAQDVTHLLLVFFFWPLGTSGHFLCYAISYCLSKRESASPAWTYVNFLLLAVALNFYDFRLSYRNVFMWRDVLLISFVHYTYWNKAQQMRVGNASASDKMLLYTLHLCVLLYTFSYGDKTKAFGNLVILVMDMLQANIECVFHTRHGERFNSILYYTGAFIKAAYYFQYTERIGFLQWLIMFQLDMMTYPLFHGAVATIDKTTDLHAISFKVMSTTYAMSCFFV
jgi:hypothetical protein